MFYIPNRFPTPLMNGETNDTKIHKNTTNYHILRNAIMDFPRLKYIKKSGLKSNVSAI